MRLSFEEIICTKWNEPDFVFGRLQPGDLGLVSGADGSGKSFLSDIIALTVATGTSVNNIFQAPRKLGKVLMLKGEDRLQDHARRLQTLAQKAAIIECELDVVALHGERKPIVRKCRDGVEVTEHFDWLMKISEGFRMLILDPLIMFHDLPEDNSIDSLARALIRIAHKNNLCILAIHHASQDAIINSRSDHHAGRGSTALPAACRQVWTLRTMSQKESDSLKFNEYEQRTWRFLANGKASHGQEFCGQWIKRDDSGILYRPPYPPKGCRAEKVNHNDQKKGDWDEIDF